MLDTTCWTVIRGAAEGRLADREEFSRRYERIIRAYLAARWQGPLLGEIDDAVQEVFVDCFREGGALGRADPARPGGFRAFLFGVVRHVAQRVERARARAADPLDGCEDASSDGRSPSQEFDRAWAQSLVRQAAQLQAARARATGPEACRRVELLRLRFGEDLPIREIAARWNDDPARLHHEYAKARHEFRAALKDVVAEHVAGTPAEIDKEAERLIACFAS